MKIRHFRKGEKVDFMSFAGEDFDQITDGNIRIDCFPKEDYIQIPCLESDKESSGGLDKLLKEIEMHYKKRLVFVNMINPRLEKHLIENGYEIKELILT